jgi:two-component sensor histidine kinase
MMARELDHRVKNNLAEVLALVEQSGTSASSYEEFREAFAGRVRAMARTHEALAARHWRGVPLREVADLTLEPYTGAGDDRIVKHGDAVVLAPTASSALGMMLHELAANAAKHGALAVSAGRVELSWRREQNGDLEIVWRERGGPPVARPEREGFGMRLVRGVVTHELGGTLAMEFDPQGLCCEIHIPREHLQESEEAA